jgi:hypothetical protein
VVLAAALLPTRVDRVRPPEYVLLILLLLLLSSVARRLRALLAVTVVAVVTSLLSARASSEEDASSSSLRQTLVAKQIRSFVICTKFVLKIQLRAYRVAPREPRSSAVTCLAVAKKDSGIPELLPELRNIRNYCTCKPLLAVFGHQDPS